jgi:hypothetical protein
MISFRLPGTLRIVHVSNCLLRRQLSSKGDASLMPAVFRQGTLAPISGKMRQSAGRRWVESGVFRTLENGRT